MKALVLSLIVLSLLLTGCAPTGGITSSSANTPTSCVEVGRNSIAHTGTYLIEFDCKESTCYVIYGSISCVAKKDK